MGRVGEFVNGLGIRFRLILSFCIVLLAATLGTTFTISCYNKRFLRNALEENNAQKMKEIDYELNSLFSKINQIFLSFNSGQIYRIFQNDQMSYFESMELQLEYESGIKENISVNNLQNAVRGNIFYLNQDRYVYVGTGTMQKDFAFEEAQWARQFWDSGGRKLIYGPLTEDYRTENSIKEEVLYFIRSWNIPPSSGLKTEEEPFILFSIRMDYVRSIFEEYQEDNKGFLVMDEEGGYLFCVNLDEGQEQEIMAMIDSGADDGKEGTWLDEKWFVAGVPNPELGWEIYSAESTSAFFADMNRLIHSMILIVLGTGFMALLLAVLFSSRIMMPITLLNKLISTIEEENDTFIEVKSNDELGQIGLRFNEMKRKLQEMSADMYLSRVQEKEAQLSALQSQINPHFLYNTLDNIYCIAQIEEVDSIVLLTENLSKMMRYSMDMKNHEVALEQELEHAQAYVDIINIRFDGSIVLNVDVDAELKSCRVLKLTLQPVVENAWSHGLLPKQGHKGSIGIKVRQYEDLLEVEVTDDGVGIPAVRCAELNREFAKADYRSGNSQQGSGVALKNVNNRIKLAYGPEYGVTICSGDGAGCRVLMRMKKCSD